MADRLPTLAEIVELAITSALLRHKGNRTRTARELGISVRTLRNHIYALSEKIDPELKEYLGRWKKQKVLCCKEVLKKPITLPPRTVIKDIRPPGIYYCSGCATAVPRAALKVNKQCKRCLAPFPKDLINRIFDPKIDG